MKLSKLIGGVMLPVALVLQGCAVVTISKDGGGKISSAATYEDSKSYFMWGLVGDHTIDVKEVCQGSDAQQMQSVNTVQNVLFGLVTLGIYSPRTSRVWCQEKG